METIPAYSLQDLANDLRTGVKSQFFYNGETFTVTRPSFNVVIITHDATGHKGKNYGQLYNMIDYQGIAASILYYKEDIYSNHKGEIFFSDPLK